MQSDEMFNDVKLFEIKNFTSLNSRMIKTNQNAFTKFMTVSHVKFARNCLQPKSLIYKKILKAFCLESYFCQNELFHHKK